MVAYTDRQLGMIHDRLNNARQLLMKTERPVSSFCVTRARILLEDVYELLNDGALQAVDTADETREEVTE